MALPLDNMTRREKRCCQASAIDILPMKIKRLEIVGFKSFVDKVSLDFQHGITGVVGPNGCGKSNIVDAIRWVMGEQTPAICADE